MKTGKGIFMPDITVEMFRNASLEAIEELLAEGEVYDIDLKEELHREKEQAYMKGYEDGQNRRILVSKGSPDYRQTVLVKIVETAEAVSIDVKGITLLSIEEYESYEGSIKPIVHDWWLRSLGDYAHEVAIVSSAGAVLRYGVYVFLDRGLRPALKINLESSDLRTGDEIEWANYRWTVISDNLMLCDEFIAEKPFRKDWQANDANQYEKSDAKIWLENWLAEQMER